MNTNESTEKKYKRGITILSIVIPVAVAALFGINLRALGFDVEPLSFLPPIYATINGITAVLLVAAVIAIKKGQKNLHEKLHRKQQFEYLIGLVQKMTFFRWIGEIIDLVFISNTILMISGRTR